MAVSNWDIARLFSSAEVSDVTVKAESNEPVGDRRYFIHFAYHAR
ncbi:MAG: hypothetical protein JWM35_2065 [Verrucomicrobia bacterium]|nr:hypothetical protein [Verrucomicrobiota bacterium]